MPTDVYYTIAQNSNIEFKEKGSRFIGRAFFVESQSRVEEYLESTRKKYFDATHNCFAYRFGLFENENSRFSDDGEPSGTAGKPILQSIIGNDLTNVLVIVTRYFGGTKLGAGGLVRAYSQAAVEALAISKKQKCYLETEIKLHYSYELTNITQRTIENHQARIIEQNYGEQVDIVVSIRNTKVESFTSQLVELTADRIRIGY